MGIAVNAGPRDEKSEMQNGSAHMLEHSIFLRDQINCKTEIDDFCKKIVAGLMRILRVRIQFF